MAFNSSSRGKAIADINVTPLVDVMLVLLVIFMVTAPMMLNGISLRLPKTSKVTSLQMNAEQVILSLSSTGEFYLGKQKVLPTEMIEEIKSLFKKNKSDILYIRVDENLRYGKVAKLMSNLKKNGINNLALVTEVEKK